MTMDKVAIKEADPSKVFLSLQRVAVDFSIWPLLSGNIIIPKGEISGIKVQLVIDRQGKANYQSILDHLATKKSPGKSEKKPEKSATPAKLPMVRANLNLSNIDIAFVDEKTATGSGYRQLPTNLRYRRP